MKSGKSLAVSLLCCGLLLPGLAQAQAKKRDTGGREERAVHIACVATISHGFDPGSVSIRVQLTGIPLIAFQQSALKVGGDATKLSPAQANQWAMVVDTFRDAARQKVKVQVSYDKSDGEVNSVWARYDLPC